MLHTFNSLNPGLLFLRQPCDEFLYHFLPFFEQLLFRIANGYGYDIFVYMMYEHSKIVSRAIFLKQYTIPVQFPSIFLKRRKRHSRAQVVVYIDCKFITGLRSCNSGNVRKCENRENGKYALIELVSFIVRMLKNVVF